MRTAQEKLPMKPEWARVTGSGNLESVRGVVDASIKYVINEAKGWVWGGGKGHRRDLNIG